MVGASEQVELNRLENQVENGGGGAWEYLCLVRKLKLRRSDKVLKHGLSVLNDSKQRLKLGHEEWTLYEQVAVAAMDCQSLDTAKDCIKTLQKKFPDSRRVGRLEGMFLEAKGLWADAEKTYSSLLEDTPLDQAIHKRKISMAKAQGNFSSAIEGLNKYLEIFMADHDAWRELAEIYVSLQLYKQAAFCYEELILCQPTVPLYHLAYADVLYTLGGLENLQAAKKYYAATIDLTGGKNTRALYGVCLVPDGNTGRWIAPRRTNAAKDGELMLPKAKCYNAQGTKSNNMKCTTTSTIGTTMATQQSTNTVNSKVQQY